MSRVVQVVCDEAACSDTPGQDSQTCSSRGFPLRVVDHDLYFIAGRHEWRRRACNISATAEMALKGLLSGAGRRRWPTHVQKWRADQFFELRPKTAPYANQPAPIKSDSPGTCVPGPSGSSGSVPEDGRRLTGWKFLLVLATCPSGTIGHNSSDLCLLPCPARWAAPAVEGAVRRGLSEPEY